MKAFGLIGTGVALLNLRKAKKAYEQALQEYNDMQAIYDAEQASVIAE